jgi:hypothetical protein
MLLFRGLSEKFLFRLLRNLCLCKRNAACPLLFVFVFHLRSSSNHAATYIFPAFCLYFSGFFFSSLSATIVRTGRSQQTCPFRKALAIVRGNKDLVARVMYILKADKRHFVSMESWTLRLHVTA